MSKYLNHLLKNVPHRPGVYRMKNKDGDIIYIGKAKDLFKRVGSYFRQIDKHTPKTAKMVENITDFDYTVAGSELEALILETNLIKEHRPKYNVLMKDDKNYAYIKVTTGEDYPRIFVVRKVLNDKARYFGPKTAAGQIYETLNHLRKIFPFRNCGLQLEDLGPAQEGDINKKRLVKVTKAGIKYPCLDLHIKRCLAPCIGKPTKEEYREVINKIIELLEGKYQQIVDELKDQMRTAAQNKKFEQAAKLRDKILSIENIYQNQLASNPDHQHADIINYYIQEDLVYFNVFQVREGKLVDQQNVIVKLPPLDKPHGEMLGAFIQQFYADNTNLPKEIIIPETTGQEDVLEKWLSDLAGHKVKFVIPQKGKNDKLLQLSLENALSFARQSRARWEGESTQDREEGLEKLAQILGLDHFPKRIECYDISHLGGTHTVASMSVFENGLPKKEHYRHFKISLEKAGSPDDFQSMNEVIFRRLKYLKPALETAGYFLKKKGESYQVKLGKKLLLTFQIQSAGKLKTFVKPFKFPAGQYAEIIRKIIEKFDTNRLYLQIPKSKLKQLEEMGFQEVKTDMPEYPANKNNLVVVYDKTRNYEDASFKKKPDLIVIDGGKGQLSYAVKALKDYHLEIPVISLAKKQEEFFLPGKTTSIQLAANDPARLLIQHIRDEAHRFAIEYNRKLRKKDYTVSELEQVTGVGKITTQKLLRKFGSLENIKNLPVEELAKETGLKTANKIKSYFN